MHSNKAQRSALVGGLFVFAVVACGSGVDDTYHFAADLPKQFDLRDVGGKDMVSSVKKQNGGTCWTHATMAALEGNLMLTGAWQAASENGEPNLAEYHLDWWNGFNRYHNADISPQKAGLTVHEGGDYRVAAAYLARGGAVRDTDGQSYNQAPSELQSSYHRYYPREIAWLSGEEGVATIEKIKRSLMNHGVVGTAITWSDNYYYSQSHSFYQPPSSQSQPNHAVSIVGWDDDKRTGAPQHGAWLVKNSWGSSWGEDGYFWIAYADKIAGHHQDMGAVSFRQVEPLRYSHIYSHDYHGWRDTLDDAQEAFNAFEVKTDGAKEKLSAVSFYTTEDGAEYAVKIFRKLESGELADQVSVKEGVAENRGFHTVDLTFPVPLEEGQKFYVYLKVSKGGLAFDRTSDVPVLLGGNERTTVTSKASAGESFYRQDGQWRDLTEKNKSANFCLKGLTTAD